MENMQSYDVSVAIWYVKFEFENHFIIESNACAVQTNWMKIYDCGCLTTIYTVTTISINFWSKYKWYDNIWSKSLHYIKIYY